MNSLLDKVASADLREVAGSRSADRFAYQQDWALCLLLKLHSERDDYLIAFDYMDDVVVFDSCSNPQKMDFYQVKGTTGNSWTDTRLLSSKNAKGNKRLSILGKLLSSYFLFPENTNSMNFVSNANFDIQLKTGMSKQAEKIAFSDISLNVAKKIYRKMEGEFPGKTIPPLENAFFFIVSGLHLTDHATHTKGKLSEFIDENFPGMALPISPLYKALSEEIRRKNNKVVSEKTASVFLREKTISKEAFVGLIASIPRNQSVESIIERCLDQLRSEGTSYREIQSIRGAAEKYEIERMGASASLAKAIDLIKASLADSSGFSGLGDILNHVVRDFKERGPDLKPLFSDDRIKAIALIEGGL